MPLSESPTVNETLLSKLGQLVILADKGMKTMNAGTIMRLRSSTRQFIILQYGLNSHFYTDYTRIDNINSQYNLNEIKGLLLAIRDNIQLELSQNNLNGSSSEKNIKKKPDNEELTGLILSLFYKNGLYNWIAINNLILSDSDYFDYTIDAAKSIFQKFIDRKIIAHTGIGQAYCITEEGKKLYEKKFNSKIAPLGKESSSNQLSYPVPVNYPSKKMTNLIEMHELFLSYSWDSPEFQQEVAAFTNFLRENGYHAKMDIMLSEDQTAIDFGKMMHVAIHQSKKVIIILSKGYKGKAENFTGGVGVEYALLFKDIEISPQKYILVSFEGISDSIIPFGLRGRDIVDCSKLNWDQKLFAKLSDEKRYIFSDVATEKTGVKKIVPGKFLKDVQAKSAKTKKDNATKIKASLRMEQRIKKDLVDHSSVNGQTERIGMFPGTYTPFISSRAIIRSVDDESYPVVDGNPAGSMSSWVREHLYELSHEGVEIWIAAALGHEVIMNEQGYWEIVSDYNDERKLNPQYKNARIMIIGTIPYYNIVEYRKNGDEYYNDPHIFCYFEFNGTPYSKIRYQVYYGEENELPTYELDPSKKIKFDR